MAKQRKSDAEEMRASIAEEAKQFAIVQKTCSPEKFGEMWATLKQLLAYLQHDNVKLSLNCSFWVWDTVRVMQEISALISEEDSNKLSAYFKARKEAARNADPAYQAMMSLQSTMQQQQVMAPDEEEEETKH